MNKLAVLTGRKNSDEYADIADGIPAPYINFGLTTKRIMLDVIIALMPALVWSVYVFGLRCLVISAISVFCCVLFELWSELLLKRDITIGDLSAVVSGMLIAFACPVSVPLYLPVLGALVMVVVKQAFGGIGQNPLNPAVTAHIVMCLAYKGMTADVLPFTKWSAFAVNTGEITAALEESTALEKLSSGSIPDYSLTDMLFGLHSGRIGEISAFMLIIGAVWLIYRNVIKNDLTLGCVVGLLSAVCIYPRYPVTLQCICYEILSGGFILVAVFCVNDYTTTPVSYRGKLIYGFLCGILTAFFRYKLCFDDGAYIAVIVMNFVYAVIKRRTDIIGKF